MGGVNSWAFSIFTVAVVIAVLDILFPMKNKNGAVSFVAGLIMVIAIYYPFLEGVKNFKAIKLPDISFSSEEIKREGEKTFYERYKETATKNMETDIVSFVKTNGLSEEVSVEALLSGEELTLALQKITLRVSEETTAAQIENIKSKLKERYGIESEVIRG